jgi:hypothetical protein
MVTAAVLLSSSAGIAQVYLPGTNTPDLGSMPPLAGTGAPSPTSAMATEAAVGGAGIPLGTTELFVGGLSPAPTDATGSPSCPGVGTTPGVGALGTTSIFQGDGTMGTPGALASSGLPTASACDAATSTGGGAPSGVAPAFTGGSIPLGATALGTGGLAGVPCNGSGSLTAAGTGFAGSAGPGTSLKSSC